MTHAKQRGQQYNSIQLAALSHTKLVSGRDDGLLIAGEACLARRSAEPTRGANHRSCARCASHCSVQVCLCALMILNVSAVAGSHSAIVCMPGSTRMLVLEEAVNKCHSLAALLVQGPHCAYLHPQYRRGSSSSGGMQPSKPECACAAGIRLWMLCAATRSSCWLARPAVARPRRCPSTSWKTHGVGALILLLQSNTRPPQSFSATICEPSCKQYSL